MQRCDKALPLTCAAIEEAFLGTGLEMLRVSISRVRGRRTYIPQHRAESQGLFRLHCPILVPRGARSLLRLGAPNSSVLHEEGHCFWFDESIDHEAYYTSPSEDVRVLLMIDVVNPQ